MEFKTLNSIKKTVSAFLLCFFLVFLPAFMAAQEEEPPRYVIRGIDFDITGRSRPFALIYHGELREGEELRGEEALEKYIRDKTQLLLNQRVLEEVRIAYTLGDPEADGKIPVNLLIIVKDTWNIIAVPPVPKYNSNTGFRLELKARDYNFLGAMNPLRIDLAYQLDENLRNSVEFKIDSDTPFKIFGYNWNLNFDHAFFYRPNVEEPFYYKNTTGLEMELPFKKTTFTFGAEESVILNDENADRDKIHYGSFQKGPYMASRLYTSWEIPTGLNIAEYGELTYTPEVSAQFNHQFSAYPLNDNRKGPFMNFEHSLGFDRFNWIGNFRRGFDVSISNSYHYDFYKSGRGEKSLDITYALTGTGHFIISDDFGISTRLKFSRWFYHDPPYYDNAGEALRGIKDDAITADYMLSLNLDFPFKIFSFLPSRWFNSQKLHVVDFDLHFSPIVDLALYHDPDTETVFHPHNMLASGGIEFLVFPMFMRSLYIRMSLAWNLVESVNNPSGSYLPQGLPVIPKLPGGSNREIYVGIGHHY
jgi:hypothetical protein